jgi:hypothetical protein
MLQGLDNGDVAVQRRAPILDSIPQPVVPGLRRYGRQTAELA